MLFTSPSSPVLLSLLLMLLLPLSSPAEGCSCPLRHPQQHYCEADFVANVKVRRTITLPGGQSVLKVRVRRLLKTNPKATAALSKKMIYTIPGSCSLNITDRSMHVITGDIQAGKPWTSACHFAQPWSSLAPKMKKGFRLLYQKSCDCPILSCHWWEHRCPSASFFCSWRTSSDEEDCQAQHGICARKSTGGCSWQGGRQYRGCMKKWRPGRHRPTHSHPNVATVIETAGGAVDTVHSNAIISNEVLPIEDNSILHDTLIAPINIKETLSHGIQAKKRTNSGNSGRDNSQVHSIGPRIATSRFHKPRKVPPVQYGIVPVSSNPESDSSQSSRLGRVHSSQFLDKLTQYSTSTNDIDETTRNQEPISFISSNHIDDLDDSEEDYHHTSEQVDLGVFHDAREGSVEFAKIGQQRTYPQYATRIGYIPQ